jgi:hypothetical protein
MVCFFSHEIKIISLTQSIYSKYNLKLKAGRKEIKKHYFFYKKVLFLHKILTVKIMNFKDNSQIDKEKQNNT